MTEEKQETAQSAEETEELVPMLMRHLPIGTLLRKVEESFEAADQTMGRAALAELNRRCDVLNSLVNKAYDANLDTLGITMHREAGLWAGGIGSVALPLPAAVSTKDLLYDVLEDLEAQLP